MAGGKTFSVCMYSSGVCVCVCVCVYFCIAVYMLPFSPPPPFPLLWYIHLCVGRPAVVQLAGSDVGYPRTLRFLHLRSVP